MAKARDGASESSVVIRFQQRLAEANNFQKALITSLLAWMALGVWSYLVVVPILSAVAFLWLGVTGWLVWRIWRKPPA
jgi:1,4-dihydroxy-2-naphthoate octaprenyltransferase